MSMTDPIADMFTRIRNAQATGKRAVRMPSSKVKLAIARSAEGRRLCRRIPGAAKEGKPELEIALKYYEGKPVIERIERVSRPGLRVYRGKRRIAEGAQWSRHFDRLHFIRNHDRRHGPHQGSGWRSHRHRRLRRENMSRVAKKPVVLPKGVEVQVGGDEITVKGPKGTLKLITPPGVVASVAEWPGTAERQGRHRCQDGRYGARTDQQHGRRVSAKVTSASLNSSASAIAPRWPART